MTDEHDDLVKVILESNFLNNVDVSVKSEEISIHAIQSFLVEGIGEADLYSPDESPTKLLSVNKFTPNFIQHKMEKIETIWADQPMPTFDNQSCDVVEVVIDSTDKNDLCSATDQLYPSPILIQESSNENLSSDPTKQFTIDRIGHVESSDESDNDADCLKDEPAKDLQHDFVFREPPDLCASESSDSDISLSELLAQKSAILKALPNKRGSKKHEFSHLDLPPVEYLSIKLVGNLPLQPLGKILHFMENLLVIESLPGLVALDDGSVIFDEHRKAIGRVFEVFGSVTHPHYTIRFNSMEDIIERQLVPNQQVFYVADDRSEFSRIINVDMLKSQKGTDALERYDSDHNGDEVWHSNDDSDPDEYEKAAKKKNTKKRKRPSTMPSFQNLGNSRGTFHPRGNHHNGSSTRSARPHFMKPASSNWPSMSGGQAAAPPPMPFQASMPPPPPMFFPPPCPWPGYAMHPNYFAATPPPNMAMPPPPMYPYQPPIFGAPAFPPNNS